MTNREVSRQALAVAIAAVELQREALGEAAANTTLFALRQKLALIEAEPASNQQAELVVLAADLSGFTALAEQMDAERVRDAINAMWKVLDGVVQSWGGHIDQHAGDGMLALFGLPRPRPHDLQRALRTALALQTELRLFNETARQQRQSWAAAWTGPTMRIGVHYGPVFFGKADYGNRHTAVGETVNQAKALEQAASIGGVLVSPMVAQAARAQFETVDTTTAAPDPINQTGQEADQKATVARISNGSVTSGSPLPNGKSAYAYASLMPQPYQIIEERHSDNPPAPGLVAGQETRFVGRERELDFLENALQTVLDGRFPQVVTMTAEPGAGSTRLLYEFERRLRLLPDRLTVLRSQLSAPRRKNAPSFWQESVFRYAGLHLNDSPGVLREKLAKAIGSASSTDQTAYELASTLLSLEPKTAAQRPPFIAAINQLFHSINNHGAVVLFLEQVHQASAQSLDLLDALVEQSPDLPLLVVATAPPTFLEQRSGWQEQPADPFAPYSHLPLQPLSAIDGRHLLAEVLQRLPSPPLRLLDLIATVAQGNPLHIEETVQLLLAQGAIMVDSGGRWHVDMAQVETTKLPATLDELFRARLAQLSVAEQRLLTDAAAVGPLFWDAALWQDETGENPLTAGEVEQLLAGLLSKDMVRPEPMWDFGDAQAYRFTHLVMVDAAHALLTERRRQTLQRQMAYWLQREWENGRTSHAFPTTALITHYLEQAGEATRPIEPHATAIPVLASSAP